MFTTCVCRQRLFCTMEFELQQHRTRPAPRGWDASWAAKDSGVVFMVRDYFALARVQIQVRRQGVLGFSSLYGTAAFRLGTVAGAQAITLRGDSTPWLENPNPLLQEFWVDLHGRGCGRSAQVQVRAEFVHASHHKELGPQRMRVSHRAGASGCLPLVKALDEGGICSPWLRCGQGLSTLEHAAMHGTDDHADVVEYLLAQRQGRAESLRGHVKSNPGMPTPLHHAATGGNPRTVRALCVCDDWLNLRDPQGLTPFAIACAHGHLAVVQFLAQQEYCLPDNPSPAMNGDTPMMQVHGASRVAPSPTAPTN